MLDTQLASASRGSISHSEIYAQNSICTAFLSKMLFKKYYSKNWQKLLKMGSS